MSLRFRAAMEMPTLAAAALLALAAAGCDRSFTWIGPVGDSDALAAITVNDGDVRVYVCGGPTTYYSLTRWFEGRVSPPSSLDLEADGWTFQGSVSDAWAYGEMYAPFGDDWYFIDAPRAEGELTGLYSVMDSGCRTGVIVQDDGGGEPSLQGTWCDENGNFAQVTPVYPIQVVGGQLHVQVDLGPLGLGIRDLYVTRDAGL